MLNDLCQGKESHQGSGMFQQEGDWGGGREVRGEGIMLERSRVHEQNSFMLR